MLRASEKLLLIKSKITSISGNTYSYYLILAATLAAFYNYYFVLLVFFLIYKFRKVIKIKYIVIIIALVLLSFALSKVKEVSTNPNVFKATVVDVDDYGYVVSRRLKKYYIITSLNFEIGDVVLIEGDFQRFDTSRTPYGFNQKKYYLSNSIYARYKNPNIQKTGYNYLYLFKNKFSKYLDTYPTNVRIYLRSLIFGKNNFEKDYKQVINNLQISYLLSLSGVFVYAIIGLFNKIYFHLNIKLSTQHKINIVFLMLWTLLAGFKFVLVRILVLYIYQSLNKNLYLKFTRIDVLFLTFLTLIIFNFNYIYSIGFSLSFIILTLLALLEGVVKIKNNVLRLYINYFLIYMFSLPIFIMMNNRIYFIIFLVTPLLILLFRKAYIYVFLVLLIFPYLTIIVEPQISLLETTLMFLSKLNFNIVMPNFNKILIFLYYIALLWVFIEFDKSQIKRFLFVLLVISTNFNKAYFDPGYRLYFLDVGQGDTTILITPFNNEVVVVDAYGDVVGVLNRLGIRKIDYLILTHPDYDHIKEANNLISEFKVLNIIVNPYDDYNLNRSDLLKVNNEYIIKGRDFEINFWGPIRNYYDNNDNSLIFTLTYLNRSILFLGDASTQVEKEVVSQYQNLLEVDILKLAHHGSQTSTSNELLNMSKPTDLIISCGFDNRYGFPHYKVMERVEKKYQIYRTDLNYTIYYYQIGDKYQQIKYNE